MAKFSVLLATATTFLCSNSCGADVTADLLDPTLEQQYDWAMYMDVHDLKGFLNYPTSQLSSMTDLRVIYRPLARGIRAADYKKARVYEEFWYHDEMPIGLRRNDQIQIDSNKFGIIYVQPRDGESDHTPAIANAVVRIMVDLWIHNIVAGYVVVPIEKFNQMEAELSRYGFFPTLKVAEGPQLSIHLRSNPKGRDELYFFQKGY
ncbi:MAG: hypothetical protein JST89_25005 [Cyanobacteria bacterium SZAS-4]|nr:hypothetical protein [Cyanobacteria bacterium SZAS-4]